MLKGNRSCGMEGQRNEQDSICGQNWNLRMVRCSKLPRYSSAALCCFPIHGAVFSKFNTDATSLNGRMTGATCEFELNRDIPNDWVSTSKNEDGTVRLEIQAHVCAVPEPICRGLTVMRFPVWSNEPVGIPLGKCVAVIPRVKIDEM